MSMKSINGISTCLILLFGLSPAAGTQAVDTNADRLKETKSVVGAAFVEDKRINPPNSLDAGEPDDSSLSKVAYFSSEKVKAAELADSPKPVGKVPNTKTGNLYPWSQGDQSLAVRISRQETGEQAQTHEFRHVIYVLSGSATFVTDGTMVDPKPFEPITPWGSKEMRASRIDGGMTYHLSKGDLITVPKEIPHWWKDVPDSPLIYIAINFVGAHGRDLSPEPGVVTYFDSKKMAAGFSKGGMRPDGKGGSVIFDGKNVGSQYQVYAMRRDGGPWEAEVHALDSDVIYVQEGSATLVTGGTVVKPRNIEPNETRGTAIMGGETRHLSKGDLIIVPHGTPLWYKEAQGPFSFLLVKIR
jgi:quercetin dioxygenase-like cupin family protein